jgi:hypothetical protein
VTSSLSFIKNSSRKNYESRKEQISHKEYSESFSQLALSIFATLSLSASSPDLIQTQDAFFFALTIPATGIIASFLLSLLLPYL